MNLFKSSNTLFALGIILLAVISRLIPHALQFLHLSALLLYLVVPFCQIESCLFFLPCLAAWFSGIILNNLVYQSIFTRILHGLITTSFGKVSVMHPRQCWA